MSKISHCLMSTVFRSGVSLLRADRVVQLGRSPDSDIVLPHHAVSRRHSQVVGLDDGRFAMEDLDSSNGTFVNGYPVKGRHILVDNDTINIGPFELSYREFAGDLHALLDEARMDTQATLPAGFGMGGGQQTQFGGKFTGMELVEICQFLAFNHKDGLLHIEGNQVDGEIEFLCGDILAARVGNEEGQGAARRLLQQPRGTFQFTTRAPDFRAGAPILQTVPFLMELCRERDESETRIIDLDDFDLNL